MVGAGIWKRLVSHAILIAVLVVVLLPLLWVLRTSFADKVVAYKIPPDLFFSPTLENYREILDRFSFGAFFMNSIIIAISSTAIGRRGGDVLAAPDRPAPRHSAPTARPAGSSHVQSPSALSFQRSQRPLLLM